MPQTMAFARTAKRILRAKACHMLVWRYQLRVRLSGPGVAVVFVTDTVWLLMA